MGDIRSFARKCFSDGAPNPLVPPVTIAFRPLSIRSMNVTWDEPMHTIAATPASSYLSCMKRIPASGVPIAGDELTFAVLQPGTSGNVLCDQENCFDIFLLIRYACCGNSSRRETLGMVANAAVMSGSTRATSVTL